MEIGNTVGKMRDDTADLYLAADDTYIQLARQQNLLAETVPFGAHPPVIAVLKGNRNAYFPFRTCCGMISACRRIPTRPIGRTCRELKAAGSWDAIEKKAKVFKPTERHRQRRGPAWRGIVGPGRRRIRNWLCVAPEFENGAQLVSTGC